MPDRFSNLSLLVRKKAAGNEGESLDGLHFEIKVSSASGNWSAASPAERTKPRDAPGRQMVPKESDGGGRMRKRGAGSSR